MFFKKNIFSLKSSKNISNKKENLESKKSTTNKDYPEDYIFPKSKKELINYLYTEWNNATDFRIKYSIYNSELFKFNKYYLQLCNRIEKNLPFSLESSIQFVNDIDLNIFEDYAFHDLFKFMWVYEDTFNSLFAEWNVLHPKLRYVARSDEQVINYLRSQHKEPLIEFLNANSELSYLELHFQLINDLKELKEIIPTVLEITKSKGKSDIVNNMLLGGGLVLDPINGLLNIFEDIEREKNKHKAIEDVLDYYYERFTSLVNVIKHSPEKIDELFNLAQKYIDLHINVPNLDSISDFFKPLETEDIKKYTLSSYFKVE